MVGVALSCALLLCDDFTGRPISGSGALFRGRRGIVNPVRRRDSCYLFLNWEEPEIALTVSLPGYIPRPVRIQPEELPPGNPLAVLRMFRAYAGSYTDCEWVQGRGAPEELVMVVEEADPQLGLRMENEGDATKSKHPLTLTGYTTRKLEGLCYAADGNGKVPQPFLISERGEGGTYYTEGLQPWRPGEVISLRRAYHSRCDEEGRYWIPVRPGCRIAEICQRGEDDGTARL